MLQYDTKSERKDDTKSETSNTQRYQTYVVVVSQAFKAHATEELLATYQIRVWSQRGTKVNRLHHGDILLRSPPWFGIETKKIISSVVLNQLHVDRYTSEKSHKDETYDKRTQE